MYKKLLSFSLAKSVLLFCKLKFSCGKLPFTLNATFHYTNTLPFIDERAQKYKNMKKSNLNTILLIIIIVLLIICAYGIYSRPTLEQIDERIMHWGQHFGAVFSN